ncbi:hypothetical protein ACLOJK_001562 [Asimina triloba]
MAVHTVSCGSGRFLVGTAGRCQWTDQISRSTVASQWILMLPESMDFAVRCGEDGNGFLDHHERGSNSICVSPAIAAAASSLAGKSRCRCYPLDPEPNRSGRPTRHCRPLLQRRQTYTTIKTAMANAMHASIVHVYEFKHGRFFFIPLH